VKGWNYSFEKIVENNPDMIIVSDKYDTKKRFIQTDRYKDLSAVKANKVFEIDDNMLVRQGPRQADGLEALAKILHPEAF
jgi:iron complex transport system substrate-binding protein